MNESWPASSVTGLPETGAWISPASGVEQAVRYAAPHGAEPDEAERRHQPSPSSATAMALISTLHRGWVARRDTSTVVVVGKWPPRYAAQTRLKSSCSATSVRNRVAETRSANVHPAASSVLPRERKSTR